MKTLETRYSRSFSYGVPLLHITTQDPRVTESTLLRALEHKAHGLCGVIRWDTARGFTAVNSVGQEVLETYFPQPERKRLPDKALEAIYEYVVTMEERKPTVFLFHNIDPYFRQPEVVQWVWILRDLLTKQQSQLVMLSCSSSLPPLICRDVVSMEDELPDEQQLQKILRDYQDSIKANMEELQQPYTPCRDPQFVRSVTNNLRGMTGFLASQSLYLSTDETDHYALHIPSLQENRRAAVEQTKGIQFVRSNITLQEIGGLHYLKGLMRQIMEGPKKPALILFIDEIEKTSLSTGSVAGDTSGVSADALRVMLTEITDNDWLGLLAVGVPGSGKSQLAKSIGPTYDVPCVTLDLGAMKGSLVGESETNIRQAMQVIRSLAGQDVLVWGTCNSIQSLSVELLRRFELGTYYFDVPDEEERNAIWAIKLREYGLEGPLPNSNDWTGAEINRCCHIAKVAGISLQDAAKSFVPAAISERERIEELRRRADKQLKSASYEGPYLRNRPQTKTTPERRILG